MCDVVVVNVRGSVLLDEKGATEMETVYIKDDMQIT